MDKLVQYKDVAFVLPKTNIRSSLYHLFSFTMGAEISKLRDMLLGGDKKAKEDVLQQLLFLVNAANSRLDIYQAEMDK